MTCSLMTITAGQMTKGSESEPGTYKLNQFYSVYFLVANGGLELGEATSDTNTIALKAAYV